MMKGRFCGVVDKGEMMSRYGGAVRNLVIGALRIQEYVIIGEPQTKG